MQMRKQKSKLHVDCNKTFKKIAFIIFCSFFLSRFLRIEWTARLTESNNSNQIKSSIILNRVDVSIHPSNNNNNTLLLSVLTIPSPRGVRVGCKQERKQEAHVFSLVRCACLLTAHSISCLRSSTCVFHPGIVFPWKCCDMIGSDLRWTHGNFRWNFNGFFIWPYRVRNR